VATEERGQSSRDRLRTLHLQQVTHAVDCKLLDLREPRSKQASAYAKTAADVVLFYADASLSITPGARMQYSNSGFALRAHRRARVGAIVLRFHEEEHHPRAAT
jgi:hypothetical protein